MKLVRLFVIAALAAASFPATSAFAQSSDAAPLAMKLEMQAHKGYFTERCFTLEEGQQLTYEFSTRHPIEFNLHHHPADGDTVFPDRLVVKSQHSKQIVADSSGTYCFMATNLEAQPGAFHVVINYEVTAR